MAIINKSRTPDSEKNRWGTTQGCFLDACKLFLKFTRKSFVIDVAAEPETAKCDKYYVSPNFVDIPNWLHSLNQNDHKTIIGFDGLQCDWIDGFWCNPPFDLKQEFLKKAYEESLKGCRGIVLVPYEPLTDWWIENVEGKAALILEPDGRYAFTETDGVTVKRGVNFGSVFLLFDESRKITPRFRFNRFNSRRKQKEINHDV